MIQLSSLIPWAILHMNRSVLKFICVLTFFLPAFSHAYVGMPLRKLADRGIRLSALPGHYKDPITLSASAPPGTTLLITLDGNIPSTAQPFNAPIRLTKTTPVTIAIKQKEQQVDTLYCGTYLIGFSATLPITTLIIPPADLFDPARGIYIGGLTEDAKRWGNCWGGTERQAFFELFEQHVPVLAQGVGLRIFGGMTRQNKEKSLRVIARKKYGKGKFKHRIFPTKNIDEFNSLVLRTSGNDWMGTRFQDMMISSLAKDMNVDYMAYQPSVLFVNGEYWGIHNIREKINVAYLESNHGADPKQTNLIQGISERPSHGSIQGYKELFQFLSTHPPTATGFVDSVEKRMDVDNYFKYLALQIHIRNVDSKGNVRYWQAGNLDNRFRWIYYDGDLGFGAVTADYLGQRLSPVATEWHNDVKTTFLLRHLTANRTLRDQFISKYCMLLSTWLHADTIGKRVNYFKSWLEPEMERHLTRRDFRQSLSNWLSHVKHLVNYAKQRMPLAYEHLKSNFQLGERYQLEVNSPLPADKIRYSIERIPIPSLPYRGTFFKDASVRVRVEYLHPRYQFVGWEDGSDAAERVILDPQKPVVQVAATVREAPVSTRKGSVWINSIGHGKKDQPKFIEINGSIPHTDSLWLVDSKKNFSIHLSKTSLPLVITEDTTTFRKYFSNSTVSLLQHSKIRLKQFGQTLYLLEPSGAWIDSVDLLTWDTINRKEPYWVRQTSRELKPTKKVPSFKLIKTPWYRKTWVLTLMGVATAWLVTLLVWRKRNKNKLVPVLLVWAIGLLAYMPAQAQTDETAPVKHRQVDVEILKKSPLLFQGPNQIQQQHGFYRIYQPVAQPLMWVGPFTAKELAPGNWHSSYAVQAFKELPSDESSVRHMKFLGRSARSWIAGIKKEFFLIDSAKQLYLVRIDHRNGLESWYYPLVNPDTSFDVRVPGAEMGVAGGFYFWQLRFRSCSILASAVVQSDGSPDPKGFVLENLCPTPSDPFSRVKNFSKALFQKIAEQGQGGDWEKALEEELKKQQ